jgi:hypothetical protein
MIDFTKEPYKTWLREGLIAAGIDLSQPAGLETAKAVRASLSAREPYSEDVADLRAAVIADVAIAVSAVKHEVSAMPSRGWVGCIYGPPKTGKSTLSMLAPMPVACDIEDGLGWIDGNKWDCPSWPAFLDCVKRFAAGEYRTLVVDTADVLEKKLWEYLCAKNKWAGIEGPGYGKGYAEALENWVSVLTLIRKIAKDSHKNFLFTAHSQVKTILNPEGESYDRNNIALHSKVSDYFFAQMDFVSFAHFDSKIRKNTGGDFVASTSGERLLSMGGDTLTAQVGNRFGITGKVPMNVEFFKLLGRRN